MTQGRYDGPAPQPRRAFAYHDSGQLHYVEVDDDSGYLDPDALWVPSSEVGNVPATAYVVGDKRPAQTDEDFERAARRREIAARGDELSLRPWLIIGLFVLMTGQVAFLNLMFLGYAIANGWNIDAGVLQVWSGAGVVEIIGLVYLIVKYLFSAEGAPQKPRPPTGR